MNCPNCGEAYKKAPLVCLKCHFIMAGSLSSNKPKAVVTQLVSQGGNSFENLKNFVENSPENSPENSSVPEKSPKKSDQNISSFAKYYPVDNHPLVEDKTHLQERTTFPNSPIQRLDSTVFAVRKELPTDALIESKNSVDIVSEDNPIHSAIKISADLKDHPKSTAIKKDKTLNIIVISAYAITIILFLIYIFRNSFN